MLEPLKHILATQRLVLASSSPRRKHILENIGLKFEVIPSTFEENLDKSTFERPEQYALATATHKTQEVARRLAKQGQVPDLVIGADTVLSMDGKIIEKPANKTHAFELLSSFRGRTHKVYTGVVLLQPKNGNAELGDQDIFHCRQFSECTEVKFANVTDEVLLQYIDTGEPMDKAGGYGIQGVGGTLIQAISGDYFNVMGFPLYHFAQELCDLYQYKAIR